MKRSAIFIIAFFAVLMVLSMSGCVTTQYDDEQEERIVSEGRSVIESYVDSLDAGSWEMVSCWMMNGAAPDKPIYGGYYLSSLVEARVKAGDRTFTVIADTEDGRIWTNYYMFDLNEAVHDQLLPYCEKYGYTDDFTVGKTGLFYRIVSHDMETKKGKTTDTIVCFDGVIPAEFCQPDEKERAEAFLNGAPLEGFTISYTVRGEDMYMDPRILTDYLSETGNYIKDPEEKPKTPVLDYQMNGTCSTGMVDGGTVPGYYYMELTLEGDPSAMPFTVVRRDIRKKGCMMFLYSAAEMSGTADGIGSCEWEEFGFPFVLEEGRIRFFGDYHGYHPMLYFDEKPPFAEFTRISYSDGKAGEPEALVLQDIGDGIWSLNTTVGAWNNKGSYYIFDREQDIEYK